MQIKSEKIDGVVCRIGVRTKFSSTVTMAVDNGFIIEAVELFEAMERGEAPETGLIGIKLMGIYAGEESEDVPKEPEKPEAESSGKPLELVVEGAEESDGVVEEDLSDGDNG